MKPSWFNTLEKGILIVLAGFVFWPNAISSIALIAVLVLRVIQSPTLIKLKGKEWFHLTLPMLVLAIWARSGFAKDGGREIQLWLSWIAAFFYFKSSPYKALFIKAFSWLSVAQALIVLATVLFGKTLPSDGYSYFLREYIEQTFHVHPTFLSAAWFWAAFLFIKPLKHLEWKNIAPAVFLALMAVMMGGKMPILAFGFILIHWIIDSLKNTKWRLITIASFVVLALSAAFFSPVLSERIDEIKNINLDYKEGVFVSSTDLRLGVWNCAWETTLEHWFTGVGLGNTRAVLDNCYLQYNHPVFLEHEYNSHNQFLHYWLAGGILALIIFSGYWLWLKWYLKNDVDRSAYYFLLFFLLICLTENYFSRQFGMMFGAFMLFGLMNRSNNSIQ